MSARERKAAINTVRKVLEEREGPPDYFYSNLYHSGASAVETDEHVASGIIKRRRERQQEAELGGSQNPKDSALINLSKTMTELLKIQNAIKELEEKKVEKGLVYGWSFTIATTPVVHIDFVDAVNNSLPTDIAINIPGFPLMGLTIWNDSGADIKFTINRGINQGSDEAILKAGNHVSLQYQNPVIGKVSLALVQGTGASSVIRMMGVL